MEDNSVTRPTGVEALLQNMRIDQNRELNRALAGERWHDASEIQQAICLLLDATGGDQPEGLSLRVTNAIRNVFQRLYRFHRNRGDDERRDRLRLYAEDIQSLTT